MIRTETRSMKPFFLDRMINSTSLHGAIFQIKAITFKRHEYNEYTLFPLAFRSMIKITLAGITLSDWKSQPSLYNMTSSLFC